jgi:hypothetical protein
MPARVPPQKARVAYGTAPAQASAMKSMPIATFYDLPLSELRVRAGHTRDVLRAFQARIASPTAARERNRAGRLKAIDEALRAVDRLMPGLMDRPPALLVRSIRNLTPHERAALRQAIDAERAVRDRLARLLGEVSAAEAEEALARIEVQESVAAELSALFHVVEQSYSAPTLSA